MILMKTPQKVCMCIYIFNYTLFIVCIFLELTNSYKEDGNFNFKHKNYRLAIIAYTEAIKIKCGNADLEATLYNNRAAANYFLENYRYVFLAVSTNI